MPKIELDFTRNPSDSFTGGVMKKTVTVEFTGTLKLNGVAVPESGIEYILTMGARNPLMDSYSASTTRAAAEKVFGDKLSAMQKGTARVGSGRESDPVERAWVRWSFDIAMESWRKNHPGKPQKDYNSKVWAADAQRLRDSKKGKESRKAYAVVYGRKTDIDSDPTPVEIESNAAA